MKQYSFLSESFNKLVKRLNRYSPEDRRKITSKLIKLGKKNGGLYSSDEYGKRMLNGQVKRMHNIAKNNKRNLNILRSSNWKDSRIVPSTNVRVQSKPTINWDDTIDFLDHKTYRNSIRGIDSIVIPKHNIHNPLSMADVVAHETDEYSKLFSNAKKLKLKPGEVNYLTYLHNKTNPGKHNLGVLKRELKRRNNLKNIYDVDFPNRDPNEIIHNDVSLKTLLKYKGSIKEQEKELLQNPTTKQSTLDILRKQKEILDKFILRKNKIHNMKDGLEKNLKLHQLKQDIELYNRNLDANRKQLKLNL